MSNSQVELAARNNAKWCDAVCRAHRLRGEFFPEVWLTRGSTPPYYSNVVVISSTGTRAQWQALNHVHALMKLPLPAGWSVKDSFSNLDLGPLGFDVLFNASWIWREPAVSDLEILSANIFWTRISSSTELTKWEESWTGDPRNSDAVGRQVQFPGSILDDRNIAFFAGYMGKEIVAGGIANRSDGVVGLSNVFVNGGDAVMIWNDLIKNTVDVFPGLPLVGYERDHGLEMALNFGFKSIGSLRVWGRKL